MKKLPIGIQTFEKITLENYCYVDKTRIIYELINNGTYFFLSRPRRFGKSLLIDTIKSLFEGREEFFKGLWIEDKWDFSKKYPVIKIDFGEGVSKNREELRKKIDETLKINQDQLGVQCEFETATGRFREIMTKSAKKYNQRVVVLIDEYDKPILDNIENPEIAQEMREELKNLYSVLKSTDACIKFVMLTGVSKFSKVSLFSGLNNLKDITLDERFATICGYTQKDLETIFGEYLIDVDLEKVKLWYNGYSWFGESVYNPFDILLFLDSPGKEFKNYWFETGSPTFLLKLLKERRYYMPDLERIRAGESLIGSFDVDCIESAALLFQTGYLTIKNKRQTGAKIEYELTYPNLEVKSSLNDYLLFYLNKDAQTKENTQSKVYDAIEDLDFELLRDTFFRLFAAIPYEWYIKNELDKYEGYYASIFYAVFASLGYSLSVEESTNRGRIDMAIKTDKAIIIFEFKVVEEENKGEEKDRVNTALEQIKNKRYYEKYLNSGSRIYLIGIEFSMHERNITRFDWELYSSGA
ncbi:ATP-binding protein [Candidatus Desantisbacteria bacterium]|nr:ATP-binding protein [Candidatus Desantisbacteria bacterium]